MSKDRSDIEDLDLREEDAENVTAGTGHGKTGKTAPAAKTSMTAQTDSTGPAVVSYQGAYPPSPPEQPVEFTEDDC